MPQLKNSKGLPNENLWLNHDITIVQEIEVNMKGSDEKYSFEIERDWLEGGNISEVNPQFKPSPYIEDGVLKHDIDMEILYILFNPNYIEFEYINIDQVLYEMYLNETIETVITYTNCCFETTKYEIEIKLIDNSYYYNN